MVKPFWIFGVERSVQNIVGASEFGFYFSLLNFSMILYIILDLGIINFNNRNIAQNPSILSKHFSNIIALKFLLAVVYGILSVLIATIIGYDKRQMMILGVLLFNQFLLSTILYLRSNISGLQYFKTDSMISVLDRLLMIIFCSILIWGGFTDHQMKIEWFVLSQTAAYLLTAITAFFIVLGKADFFKLNFDFKFFRVFLKQSYPYALLILLMAFYNRIDSVMLERLLPDGKEQAGIYAQAYRILEAASMFGFLFAGLLLPMFAKMLKKKESVEDLSKLSFSMIIVPAIAMIGVCVFYSEEIMSLMYWEHVSVSSQVLSVIIIGFAGVCTTYIFGTLLTANGSLKYLNIMATGGMILNIVLNLILIPKYQVLGAAISSMVTQIATGISQLLISTKLFKFRINYKLILSLCLFIAISILLSWQLKFDNVQWYYTAFASITISIVFAFILGMFKLKPIFEILKANQENKLKKPID